jgi:hypothetical protein
VTEQRASPFPHRGSFEDAMTTTNQSEGSPPDPADLLAPLLAAMAAIAAGDEMPRQSVEQALAQLEEQGWMLRGPVERIWAGERRNELLTAGLDAQDAALVEHLLALIAVDEAASSVPLPQSDGSPSGGSASSDALTEIAAAAEGLLMPSESDYPFEPFRWDGPAPLTPETLRTHLDLPPDAPVEMRDAMALLDQLAAEQDWFGAEERAVAARFATLRDTIASKLTDVVLYRIGTTRITLIIAGRDPGGDLVGLRTMVVET